MLQMKFRLLLSALIAGVTGTALVAAEPGGDSRRIRFVLPVKTARAQAKQQRRLLFVKPIYGGVDRAGYKDYRCGSW